MNAEAHDVDAQLRVVDADPTARPGDTCLHLIARRGYWHLGRFVLMQVVANDPEARRAAANQQNAAGQTPLSIACETTGREDMVLLLCKAGTDPNYVLGDATMLMRTAVSGQGMAIDILHRYGARLGQRSEQSGRTALIKAALVGRARLRAHAAQSRRRPALPRLGRRHGDRARRQTRRPGPAL